jgi:putative tryptophan/tyrosine transport system substrate-binding protein
VRRREFIKAVVGLPGLFPGAVAAHQGVRQIGVLFNELENDPEVVSRLAALRQALQELGWTFGENLRVDVRYGTDNVNLQEKAKELVDLSPEIIVANAPPSIEALLSVNSTIPMVFAAVTDPVGLGIVQSLAHRGGNATGFLTAEFGFGAKWLELLTEIAPGVRRVVIITEQNNPSATAQFAAIQTVASSVGVELTLVGSRDDNSIERGVSDFVRSGNGGLIALRLAEVISHRKSIIKLAAQHRLPAIYPLRIFAIDGGLISYGPDTVDQFRRAASYVDRILKGEKPADLPVQAPTKYELVINRKTAETLGLTVPPSLLARADDVID